MDKTTVFGIILGFVGVFVGMMIKGAPLSSLFNPAAILIIFVGTAAAVMIAFPMNELKKVPDLFRLLFKEQELPSEKEIIPLFTEWAGIARKEGLLALETKVDEVDNTFLKHGMKMVIDGQPPELVRDMLEEELATMEERHLAGALIFTQAGTYAPTLGVLGAVVGLIAALGNLSNVDALGPAIAAAFVATLLGIFSGYVLWHPFANKLKRKSKQEMRIKQMIIEGILAIQEGVSARVIEDKLLTYIPTKDRKLEIETQAGENLNG